MNYDEGGPVRLEERGELSEDDWLKQIINDEIISPLYYVFRIFAALLFISGIAMVMPLFDPLRYRGLIYYNGLIFSFVAALSSFLFIRSQKSLNIAITTKDAAAWQENHLVMIVLGAVFFAVFILTALSLVITRKQTKEGRE
ncbi:MAG: hypothetical protein A2176_06195 [Spirochaetes bacterium RBG_13_51_14]|nr:MAG: hypothetical protein A2176_06195 [Spirochaetes bacterium RBG_13_51_14]